MLVDLMTDIRKQIATMMFRTQLAVQRPPPLAMPNRRIFLSGPGDAGPAGGPPQPAETGNGDAVSAAFAGSTRVGRTPGRPSPPPASDVRNLQTNRGDEARAPQPVRVEQKVGRNDPCPCGSGRKYKKCHGAAEG
jgi:preprotein translocase subunit SecA